MSLCAVVQGLLMNDWAPPKQLSILLNKLPCLLSFFLIGQSCLAYHGHFILGNSTLERYPWIAYSCEQIIICYFLKFHYRSVNFERTFCYPRILPKNEQNNSIVVLLGKKTEFVRSFFGRIVGLKKTLRLCLTFSNPHLLHSRQSCIISCFIDKSKIYPEFQMEK